MNAQLKIITIARANCPIEGCPKYDDQVTIISLYKSGTFYPMTQTAGGVAHLKARIPIGSGYAEVGEGAAYDINTWQFDGANIQMCGMHVVYRVKVLQ